MIGCLLLLSVVVAACCTLAAPPPSHFSPTIPFPSKRGIGLAERRLSNACESLQMLKGAWFYNWNPSTACLGSSFPEFVPMIWGANQVDIRIVNDSVAGDGSFVLGFNEPDNQSQASAPGPETTETDSSFDCTALPASIFMTLHHQANLTVGQALQLWPKVAGKAQSCGSPAVASEYDWLSKFLKSAQPAPAAVCVHHYGINSDRLQTVLQQVVHRSAVSSSHGSHQQAQARDISNLPVILTEWAAQTHSESEQDPNKYTKDEVTSFMKSMVTWMEQKDWVLAYSWHDSGVGSSALLDSSGQLTALGAIYASL